MLRTVLGLVVLFLLAQCTEESTVIKKKQLGEISNSTTIEELDEIFKMTRSKNCLKASLWFGSIKYSIPQEIPGSFLLRVLKMIP